MQQTEKFDVFYFVICMRRISLKEENSRAQKEKVEVKYLVQGRRREKEGRERGQGRESRLH